MRGNLGPIPEEPALERPTLHLFHDEKDPDPTRGAGFFTARDGESLARAIQMLLDKPVVDETLNEPHEAFTVRTHRSAEGTVFLESVLRNIEVQSDLQLSLERRPIDVARLFLTE